MRKPMNRFSRGDDESDINLTPMLDVVFIMLIFFIVTATFVKAGWASTSTSPDEQTSRKRSTPTSVSIVRCKIGDRSAIGSWIDNSAMSTGARVRAQTSNACTRRTPKGAWSYKLTEDRPTRS